MIVHYYNIRYYKKINKLIYMKYILLLLSIAFCITTASAQNTITEADLVKLDNELNKINQYDKIKYHRIDSLKKILTTPKIPVSNQISTALKIGKEYESFITDSAMVYYDLSLKMSKEINDSLKILEARLGRIRVLGVSGFFTKATSEIEEIENGTIPESLKATWLDAARQLYSFMQGYTEGYTPYTKEYTDLLNYYRDNLIQVLDKDSDAYKFFLAESYISKGDINKGKLLLMDLITEIPVESNFYARATNILATLKENEGKFDAGAYYLALSAISDIKGSVKENRSLQTLANYLYQKGDIKRAYRYITSSMEDAMLCNARLRTMQISKNMPLIADSYKVQIDEQRKMLLLTVIIVSILSVCLIIAIILGLLQMKKLKIAQQRLNEANSIKEEYMGHFLDLCSIYMERLDNFCKVVSRKVSTGQIEDLIKLTKSPKFADEQHKKFYENFDGAFLHIYPDFVKEFNSLLHPDERIDIKEPGKLTPELRIFAFLRMGVEDSTKIAGFLNFSVNTVYAYRNKMKNKAINRDSFERDVMKIGHVQ